MFKDLISLIIPVYNGEEHLMKCFENIEKQDYRNLEIIFIDNMSTDQTNNILELYCSGKKNNFLLKCYKKGPSAARNMGINFSNGRYISFLDVDDSITNDKYSILYEAIIKNPQCKVVFGITRKKDANNDWKNNNYGDIKVGENRAPSAGLLWLSQFQHQVHPGAILVHRSSIKITGGFPEKLFFGEDIAFMVKLGLFLNSFYIEKLIYTKNDIPTSITSTANKYMTTIERFFHFYKYFALEYFYKKREIDLFNYCFNIIEYDSFKILIRLIKYKKKYKYINDLNCHSKFNKYTFDSSIRLYFFKNFPFKIANFICIKFLPNYRKLLFKNSFLK